MDTAGAPPVDEEDGFRLTPEAVGALEAHEAEHGADFAVYVLARRPELQELIDSNPGKDAHALAWADPGAFQCRFVEGPLQVPIHPKVPKKIAAAKLADQPSDAGSTVAIAPHSPCGHEHEGAACPVAASRPKSLRARIEGAWYRPPPASGSNEPDACAAAPQSSSPQRLARLHAGASANNCDDESLAEADAASSAEPAAASDAAAHPHQASGRSPPRSPPRPPLTSPCYLNPDAWSDTLSTRHSGAFQFILSAPPDLPSTGTALKPLSKSPRKQQQATAASAGGASSASPSASELPSPLQLPLQGRRMGLAAPNAASPVASPLLRGERSSGGAPGDGASGAHQPLSARGASPLMTLSSFGEEQLTRASCNSPHGPLASPQRSRGSFELQPSFRQVHHAGEVRRASSFNLQAATACAADEPNPQWPERMQPPCCRGASPAFGLPHIGSFNSSTAAAERCPDSAPAVSSLAALPAGPLALSCRGSSLFTLDTSCNFDALLAAGSSGCCLMRGQPPVPSLQRSASPVILGTGAEGGGAANGTVLPMLDPAAQRVTLDGMVSLPARRGSLSGFHVSPMVDQQQFARRSHHLVLDSVLQGQGQGQGAASQRANARALGSLDDCTMSTGQGSRAAPLASAMRGNGLQTAPLTARAGAQAPQPNGPQQQQQQQTQTQQPLGAEGFMAAGQGLLSRMSTPAAASCSDSGAASVRSPNPPRAVVHGGGNHDRQANAGGGADAPAVWGTVVQVVSKGPVAAASRLQAHGQRCAGPMASSGGGGGSNLSSPPVTARGAGAGAGDRTAVNGAPPRRTIEELLPSLDSGPRHNVVPPASRLSFLPMLHGPPADRMRGGLHVLPTARK